jgi:hypothetical protein
MKVTLAICKAIHNKDAIKYIYIYVLAYEVCKIVRNAFVHTPLRSQFLLFNLACNILDYLKMRIQRHRTDVGCNSERSATHGLQSKLRFVSHVSKGVVAVTARLLHVLWP